MPVALWVGMAPQHGGAQQQQGLILRPSSGMQLPDLKDFRPQPLS